MFIKSKFAAKSSGNIMSQDRFVVYINWDGFAKYYYNYAKAKRLLPVISNELKKGVIFNNAFSGIPSITVPMQTSIVSGAWPSSTQNMYRYFDKRLNKVVQMGRENKCETIAESIYRQGLSVASINQFTLENRGTTPGDIYCPYITSAPGKNGYGDYDARFSTAIDLINGKVVGTPPYLVQLYEPPDFLALYIDDLDGIGHNFETTYGIKPAKTEQERLLSILKRLHEMDKKLGTFINTCKKKGIYANMTFILTTDHGMSPYGAQSFHSNRRYGNSKLPEALEVLERAGYKVEVLFGGQTPKADTDIVIVTLGLELQLSFTKGFDSGDLRKITAAFSTKDYIGKIMTKDELIARGCCEAFADMLISPKPPYHFKTGSDNYKVRGQHDSLDETSQHIFSAMWGKGIKNNYICNEKVYNIDFAKTICYILGVDCPKDATGKLLYDVLDNSHLGYRNNI